jgi:fructokinase
VDETVAGHPEFTIHEDVAWDFLEWTPDAEALAARADAVCFGTLAQRADVTRDTVRRFLAATRPDCLRVYDVNLRQDYYRREWVEQSLEDAVLVKLNEHEATVLGAMLEFGRIESDETESLAGFARRLAERYELRGVCVTRAECGCVVVSGDESAEVPGRPIELADAVGAGDAFTAALIYASLNNWPLTAAARFANTVGGLVASRNGAMPPLRDELARLIAQNRPGAI